MSNKVDSIFDKLWEDYTNALGDDGVTDYTQTAKTSLYQLMREVIGSFDVSYHESNGAPVIPPNRTLKWQRNELRTEQLVRLDKAFGVKKTTRR